MICDPKIQDEIHSKLLHFNESIGTFGMSMAIRSRTKEPLGKKVQSFQIILFIAEVESKFQSHLLKLLCLQLLLQPSGG
jgi:hypothetical protein